MPTKIEWCDETINPLGHGCYGPGGTAEKPKRCSYCYAEKLAKRNMRGCELCRQFIPHTHFEQLEKLQQWKKPRNIFIQSMGDLFHDAVPADWIQEVFSACEAATWHRYLFLTKNPSGVESAIDTFTCEERSSEECYWFFQNFWFGTTITKQEDVNRISVLTDLEEGHRFLSIEPLLEPITLKIEKSRCPICGSNEIYEDNAKTTPNNIPTIYCDCCGEWKSNTRDDCASGIDWVIIGAETGNRKNKVIPQREWIEKIVEGCTSRNVPVFMKNSLEDIWGEPLICEFPWETN